MKAVHLAHVLKEYSPRWDLGWEAEALLVHILMAQEAESKPEVMLDYNP